MSKISNNGILYNPDAESIQIQNSASVGSKILLSKRSKNLNFINCISSLSSISKKPDEQNFSNTKHDGGISETPPITKRRRMTDIFQILSITPPKDFESYLESMK